MLLLPVHPVDRMLVMSNDACGHTAFLFFSAYFADLVDSHKIIGFGIAAVAGDIGRMQQLRPNILVLVYICSYLYIYY
jgi:hypothetical protein